MYEGVVLMITIITDLSYIDAALDEIHHIDCRLVVVDFADDTTDSSSIIHQLTSRYRELVEPPEVYLITYDYSANHLAEIISNYLLLYPDAIILGYYDVNADDYIDEDTDYMNILLDELVLCYFRCISHGQHISLNLIPDTCAEYVKIIHQKNAKSARMGLPTIAVNPCQRRVIPMVYKPTSRTINHKAKGNRYDDDFKAEVRRMYLLGYSAKGISTKKGISVQSAKNWVKDIKDSRGVQFTENIRLQDGIRYFGNFSLHNAMKNAVSSVVPTITDDTICYYDMIVHENPCISYDDFLQELTYLDFLLPEHITRIAYDSGIAYMHNETK